MCIYGIYRQYVQYLSSDLEVVVKLSALLRPVAMIGNRPIIIQLCGQVDNGCTATLPYHLHITRDANGTALNCIALVYVFSYLLLFTSAKYLYA